MANFKHELAAFSNADKVCAGYDFLVWDFDGTLVRLNHDWNILRAELTALIVSLPSGLSITELVTAARAHGVEQAAFDTMARHEIQGLELLPDRIALFAANQTKSAILTNNVSRTVEHFFRETDTCVPFVARDLVARPKPDPEGIGRIEEFWQGKRALLIGDTEIDMAVAEAAGIDCLLVSATDEPRLHLSGDHRR